VPLDPGYPVQRLQSILKDAAPRLLITTSRLLRKLPANAGFSVIVLDEERPAIRRYSVSDPGIRYPGPDSHPLAYVIYTSGSTGQPKGVAIEHRNAVNLLSWARAESGDGELQQTLQSTSLNFDLSVYECFVPLVSGGSIRIVENVLELARNRLPVTLINTVPSALNALLDSAGIPETTKVVNLAGEILKRDLVERIFSSSKVERVCNLYGPSETTTYSTWVSMLRKDGFSASIGKPIANTRIYILDERREPVPIGVSGEIYIGGAGVARGYLNRAQETAERFMQDPFSADPRGRMYRTGDVGRYRMDGTIEYLGRNDEQVKIRGYRIELGEIEAQLKRHEQVKEAVVLGREDVPGERRLVAYVVLTGELVSGVEELRGHLQESLPEYMVPTAFVVLESLPLTANGKVDRRALPAPDLSALGTREYEAPQGEIETALAEIWCQLLQVERVGRRDHFFELGGHSLLIVQMVERLRQAGIRAEVRSVFKTPILEELARVVQGPPPAEFEVPPNRIPEGCGSIVPSMLTLVELQQEQIDAIVERVPGGAQNIQDIYPLAPLQEGLLFHHVLQERGDAYVLPALLSIDSRSGVEEFVAALQAVIDRHDILRTAVLWEGLIRPVQVVYRRAAVSVEYVELQGGRDALEEMRERMEPARSWMDVQRAPLIRLQVAREAGSERHYVLLQSHHLIDDATSLRSALRELSAIMAGRAQELPEPVRYREFVARALGREKQEQAEEFFRRKLRDVQEPTAPFGLLNVHGDGSQIRESHQELDAGLSRRVRRVASEQGVSTATIFHAAWALVVSRTSAREDVVFGSVLLGRMQGSRNADRAVGMFINTLPLRLQLQGKSARDLVHSTHQELMELLEHEQASLVSAQSCSGVGAGLPLFSALLNYRHSAPTAAESDAPELLGGIRIVQVQERTSYPVTVSVDDLGEGFGLTAQVDERLEADRVLGYVEQAVRSLVQALEGEPQRLVQELTILPESERKQLLEGFNETAREYDREGLIHELFEEQVRKSPDAIAVVYEGEHLSYGELNARANQLGHYLYGLGVRPGQRVALCLERSLEMIVSVLGILKAGGAYVPLDPQYPVERLAYMLSDSAPVAALTHTPVSARLAAALSFAQQHSVPMIHVDTDTPRWTGNSRENPDPRALGLTSRDLAYIIYTSGSTGNPKGIVVSHRPVINLIQWVNETFQIDSADCLLFVTSICFDLSVYDIFGTLAAGATIRLVDEDTLNDPRRLAQILATEAITFWDSAPAALQMIVPFLQASRAQHPKLRLIFNSGDWIALSLPEQMRALFPQARFISLGGATEATVWSNWYEVHTVDPHWKSIPYGVPIQNARYYILDQHLQPVPIGVSGDLYIGGECLANGYTDEKLTCERFIPSCFVPGERIYRTGDLARYFGQGTIEFLGRSDFQVKIHGFRIELGEIEAHLRKHPGVEEATVLAREDEPGHKRLVAYYTSKPGVEVCAQELKEHLSRVLTSYMVPAVYVRVDAWPLNRNGKVDRKALPAPDVSAAPAYQAPQGEIESTLAAIWQELLRVQRVGRHDNFFELGGHSLSAMQALARIHARLGQELALREFITCPNLASLAELMDDSAENQRFVYGTIN
jgi:amino acid adenylation domain-containing protein